MFQVDLPKSFWGKCVHNVAHIINGIPILLLNAFKIGKESEQISYWVMGHSVQSDDIVIYIYIYNKSITIILIYLNFGFLRCFITT